MTKLGTAITEAIVYEYGTSVFLSRLSDPFWFQALGAVMGMDSSGITTSVMGALKRGLALRANELGIYICGGRARLSRNTPQELRLIAERRGFDAEAWFAPVVSPRGSTMRSPMDFRSTSIASSANGEWAVVQQGLNDRSGMAHRYHWHSASMRDFVSEPHTGIIGENQGMIMNLIDAHAKTAQTALLDIVHEQPKTILHSARYLRMSDHHEIRARNVDLKRLGAVLTVAYKKAICAISPNYYASTNSAPVRFSHSH